MVPFLRHWNVGAVPPFAGTAVRITLVPEHIVSAVLAIIVTDGIATGATNIRMALLITVLAGAQAELLIIEQVITSLFSSVALVKILPVSVSIPLRLHWNKGAEPPFVGFAVKVIELPAHWWLLPDVMLIETAGATVAFAISKSVL